MNKVRLIFNWIILLSMPIWFVFALPLFIVGTISEALRLKKMGLESKDYDDFISGKTWVFCGKER